jgi:catechol 2,3-dioxygenase-like lactoylglutathione lyase family enzyme
MRFERLDHVSINVADRTRSIAWYRDVLGLEQRGEPQADDWPVFMGEFGACIALFQAEERSPERLPESTGLRHVALMLRRDGFEEARKQLAELGVELRAEEHGNADSVYVRDPDGNVIELTTYDR